MTPMNWHFHPATEADAAELADLRLQAMRPSLMAAGRFDPARARDRFLSNYRAEDTRLIRGGDSLAGVLVLRGRADHLYLDHLYLLPNFQGLGIGRQVVAQVQAEARMRGLPIRLMALNGSPANGFYLSCGFALVSTGALDSDYLWSPIADEAPKGPAATG